MEKLSPFVDMSLTPAEAQEISIPQPPKYPYGLSICLCNDELAKLGISYDDLNTGDVVHLHALASVTSKSQNENETGMNCRVELQITHLSGESEDEENDKYEPVLRNADKARKKLYTR